MSVATCLPTRALAAIVGGDRTVRSSPLTLRFYRRAFSVEAGVLLQALKSSRLNVLLSSKDGHLHITPETAPRRINSLADMAGG